MLDARMRRYFFNSRRVIAAVSKERRQALSKAGAFIRQTARGSMRSARGPSKPGRPPHRHSDPQLYKRTFFAFDPASRSVVIGPEGFSRSKAPNVLEFGGTVRVPLRGGGVENAPVAPRPYMGPALQKNLPKMAEPWANSLRGGT